MNLRRVKRQDDYETRWCLVGPRGAIDFHCTNADHRIAREFWRSGGLEIHRREPDGYQRGEGASNDHCWLLDGPCWHDGSSLYATEQLIPLLENFGEDALWERLESEYRHRFAVSSPQTQETGGEQ